MSPHVPHHPHPPAMSGGPVPSDSQAPYPTPQPFRCDVAFERDAASVQTVGELDMGTVPILSAELAQLRRAGCRQVIIDLRGLSFMDSSGLHFLLDCHAAARQDGFTMALVPGPPAVQRVFELTATATVLPFVDP